MKIRKIEQLPQEFQNILEIFFSLSPRERIILDLRYGERKMQQEVAAILKITNERVGQLEAQALKTITTKAKIKK